MGDIALFFYYCVPLLVAALIIILSEVRSDKMARKRFFDGLLLCIVLIGLGCVGLGVFSVFLFVFFPHVPEGRTLAQQRIVEISILFYCFSLGGLFLTPVLLPNLVARLYPPLRKIAGLRETTNEQVDKAMSDLRMQAEFKIRHEVKDGYCYQGRAMYSIKQKDIGLVEIALGNIFENASVFGLECYAVSREYEHDSHRDGSSDTERTNYVFRTSAKRFTVMELEVEQSARSVESQYR